MGSVTISGCTFTNNAGLLGGAILLSSSVRTVITNSNFTNNVASGGGGALYFSMPVGLLSYPVKIESCNFEDNHAEGVNALYNSGGAIYSSVPITIADCTFKGNDAEMNGGTTKLFEYAYHGNITYFS